MGVGDNGSTCHTIRIAAPLRPGERTVVQDGPFHGFLDSSLGHLTIDGIANDGQGHRNRRHLLQEPKRQSRWPRGIKSIWACHLRFWGGAILRWQDDKAGDGGTTVWHVAEKESNGSVPAITLSWSTTGSMIGTR